MVGAHAPHGELQDDFYADPSMIIKQKPRFSQLLMMGDFNCDMLPCHAADPYMGPDRWKRHYDERMRMNTFMH
eukprot:11878453-Karenia_brevis.AAC.1